jgi:phage terminase small subunit
LEIEMGGEEAAAVAEVSEAISSSGRALKMKIHDKVRALELLGRHLGMFNDKLNVGGQPGNPVGVSHNIAFEDGGPGA